MISLEISKHATYKVDCTRGYYYMQAYERIRNKGKLKV